MARNSTNRPTRNPTGGDKVTALPRQPPERVGAQPGEKVLITGIAGGQGRLIAQRLGATFALSGVDRVPWEDHPPEINVHVIDLRKRKMEDIFRTERPGSAG